MRILLVHNFSGVRGGSDRCFLSHQTLLERKGHVIHRFTAEEDAGLLDFKWSEVFSYLYNRRAARKMAVVLDAFRPDLVHCHTIYGHLTPSILSVCKKKGVPVVMTLHDSKLICPNHRLFTRHALCGRCKGGHFYHAFTSRCFKDSFAASFLGMIEAYLHHTLNLYRDNVDLFISPSRFLKEKFLECGWLEDRIQVLPNFVESLEPPPAVRSPKGFVYCGALQEVKGIELLLNTLRLMATPVDLQIIGEGPLWEACRRFSKESPHRIVLKPFQHPPRLYQDVQSALFTVLPSLCYENQPMSILESYALGRAVLGADHGGIPELIEEGRTGALFPSGDAAALAQKIETLLKNPEQTLQMGERGREKVSREFNADLHYERLLAVYQSLL